eukprot:5337995-Pyramimonas_sp.AAC.1
MSWEAPEGVGKGSGDPCIQNILAHGKGPIAVLLLSLARIGWDMCFSAVLISDPGHLFDMQRLPLLSILALVRQGIERWQARRIIEHHRD